MRAKLQIPRIEDCQEWLELLGEDTNCNQSIAWYIDRIGELCRALAFINGQMAVANEALNERKVKAYYSLITEEVRSERYFAPSLAKDFIAAKCSQEQYAADIAERCSRTISRTIEALRSVLSALKEESKNLVYQK